MQYFSLRLWTHYFWIFAVQFTTVVLYAIMFIQLRRKIAECVALGGHNTQSLRRLNRVVGYMVLYPVIYTGLTLPLAIGRLAAMAGHPFSVSYFCVAGSLMTLSGVCDTVLYTLTRKNAVLDPVGSAATAGHVYPLSSGTKADQAEIDHPHWDNTSAVDGAPGPQNSGPNHESLPGITEIVHSTEHRVSLEEILDTAHDPSSQPVVESGSSSGDPRGANREFV